MAAGEIRAGKAFVEVFVKGNILPQLDAVGRKLQQLGNTVSAIGKKMAGLGASITAPLLLAAERFAAMGDEINKASQRTGVGVEALQELKYAAEESGASFDDLEAGLRKTSRTIYEAAAGSKKAQEDLAALGLTVEDLKGLSAEERFLKIGQALNGLGDQAAKTAIGMGIMGRGATALFPLFERGADGMAALRKRSEELGLVFSTEDAQAATKFSEILNDLWQQVKAVTFQVGAAVAQALQPFADAATKVLATVINWVKQNRTLVISVLAIGSGLLLAGTALIGLGTAITIAGSAMGGIVSAFGMVASAIGLLANPIVLIGAALVGLTGYFLYATQYGQEAMKFLSDKFFVLKDTAVEAFGGIADALAAGDIALAGQILWTALKLAWVQGTQELQTLWSQFRAGFVQTAAAAFYGALEIYQSVKASLMSAWEETTSFFGDLWDGFIGSFTSMWNDAIGAVGKGLNWIKGLFDSSFDVDAANKQLDDFYQKQDANRRKQEMANKEKRDKDKDSNVKKIEVDRDKAVKDINDREMSVSEGATENSKSEIAEIAKEKTELEKKLAELRAKAKTERKEKASDSFTPPDKMKNLEDTLNDQKSAGSRAPAGIFNIAALQSLQSSTQMDTIAKNSGDLLQEVRFIRQQKQTFQ